MFDIEYKSISDVKIGDKVITYDLKNKKFKSSNVIFSGLTNNSAKILKLNFDNGVSLKVTPDHKFLVRDIDTDNLKWVRADELTESDNIVYYNV